MKSVVAELKRLKARPILTRAAAAGKITELECMMDTCYCPRGRGYFEPLGGDSPDWRPTNDHYPILACEGGRERVDNSRLAHRLCNRVDYSKLINRSYTKDLARVEAARQAWLLLDASEGRPAA